MKFVVCLILLGCVQAGLDPKRVHFVDSIGHNFFFRGNMPTNDTSFAYDNLVSLMKERAAEEGPGPLPDNVELRIISLNNVFDEAKKDSDFGREIAFWKDGAHKDLGSFVNWPIGLEGVLNPSLFPSAIRKTIAKSLSWNIDKIPEKISQIHDWLSEQNERPLAMYVHCSAGCDRTGEICGSYYMRYLNENVTAMYESDVTGCSHRAPNYWSTTALEWYCMYIEEKLGSDLGDCMGFAKCKLFGDCTPTALATSDYDDSDSHLTAIARSYAEKEARPVVVRNALVEAITQEARAGSVSEKHLHALWRNGVPSY